MGIKEIKTTECPRTQVFILKSLLSLEKDKNKKQTKISTPRQVVIGNKEKTLRLSGKTGRLPTKE